MSYKHTRLPNGLNIILAPMSSRKSTSVSVWIKTGGRYENLNELGLSHFIEHLVFRGTKNRNALEIKQSIEGIGGHLNAFTSEECTCFYAKVPPLYTQRALEVLCDMAHNPLFNNSDIKKEKGIVKEEIRMYKDMPQHHVHDLLHEIMWPQHPLGRPLAGTCKSVDKLNQHIINAYHKRYYNPNNMVISISGKINDKQIIAEIKKIYTKIKKGTAKKYIQFKPKQTKAQIKLLNKKTEQSHLLLGFHAPKRNSRMRYALSVLSTILGGNMSSRLFEHVREQKGLAYQISSSLRKFDETGAIIIDAGVKNKKMLEAFNIILNELSLIKTELVPKNELQSAKEFICGQLLLHLDSTMNNALWMGEKILLSDKASDINKIIKKIMSVTANEIQRTAESIFKQSNLNLALIGPVDSKKKELLKQVKAFI
jgi:predicted Zn-dependent peptidase